MTDIKVFSTQWFKKYNKAITWLARLPFVGEFIFNFKKFGHYIDRKKIVEVTPNSVIEFVKLKGKKKVELKQHFFVRNEYALRLQKVFYPIWITFHIWDIITRPIPQLNLGFDTLTVYPDASSGGDSCDGVAIWGIYKARDDTFANMIGASSADGTNKMATEQQCLYVQTTTTTDNYGVNYRGFFSFKTSALGAGATISDAVLSLYCTSKGNALGSPDVHICASTQTDANNIVVGDYSRLGTTSFSNISYASLSTSAYNDFTLNASGISNISKTGVSKFGTKSNWDITGTPPEWSSDKLASVTIYYADNGSNKPKLVITYTTIVGPANVKTYKGLAAASVKTCKGLAIASVKTKKGLN